MTKDSERAQNLEWVQSKLDRNDLNKIKNINTKQMEKNWKPVYKNCLYMASQLIRLKVTRSSGFKAWT